MTTVINNPGRGEGSDSGIVTTIVGLVVLVVVVALFFIYALPAIRGNNNTAPQNGSVDVNVQLPTGSSPSPSPSTGY